jgi:rubredoxin
MEARRRKLLRVKNQNFQGWVCNECAWVFKALGPPAGDSIDAMKTHYKQQRDKAFASHVCEKYPRVTKNPS